MEIARVLFAQGDDIARWEAISQAVNLRDAPIRVLLAPGEYQFLQVDLPQVAPEELKTALRWQVKDQLAWPVESSTLDVIACVEDPASHRRPPGFVVAAANPILLKHMQRFRAHNARVTVIDIPEMAQRNLAQMLDEPGRATALLSIGESGALLTATRGSQIFFTRRFDSPFEAISKSEEGRRAVFDRLVLELQRSADVLEHQLSHLGVSKLWLAPFPHRDELLSLLIDSLYLPVKAIELESLFDFGAEGAPQDELVAAALFLPLGLALRERAVP
ncbi:hypothetical protein OPU71_02965 [Niveibacterium sp. 24ML]|uniref:hypothetical protein n=1 Tax=Niveibacterium sp. 24ML TaxID=2985512 RepID=UPI0022721277|nr:hypothetical protein [Niveibacterium sp. 24ML]MCX9155080.1 hypothetical protein [Niveibacterium sp. 24ML]